MHWSDVNFQPALRTLRQFAVLAALILVSIAAWQHLAHGRRALALALMATALVAGLLGAARPALLRWPFVGLSVVTFPVGWLMSWVLFGGAYYLVFTPVAVCFRLTGRDALERRFDPSKESYWAVKPPVTELRRYFRQY